MDAGWPTDEIAGLVSKLALGAGPPPGLSTSPPQLAVAGSASLLPSGSSSGSSTSGDLPAIAEAMHRSVSETSLGLAATQPAAAAAALTTPPNLGWGGQAIPDTAHFKAPWFGKNRSRGGGRGRGGTGGRGGRGAAGTSVGGGRRGPRRPWLSNDGDGDAEVDGAVSVEKVAAMVGATPCGEPIGKDVYQALFQLDSRACALLLKELAKSGMLSRAVELFDWLRSLDSEHPLQALQDVYSYTAMISLCISEHDAERALQLAAEMKAKRIERNVHTYTALMNVLIKCSKHGLALDTYKLMRQDGCTPNVVTMNTLIDVHGKMGNWEEAVRVLDVMKQEGVQPVLRTFNTLIIACNMCNQPREAVAVYRRMLEEGFSPNSTTYNALISAYGKDCQLHKVMEVFQEMTCRGCERSVITYSSLISACEKAGQWELAMEFFQEMCRERCSPNTVTYNSLITALAQGAQWEKAGEVFEQMRASGCRPDVVTYTALISALEKGGQWRLALEAFERMRAQGCRADGIVYNAIIDTLWETGVVWAQRRALALFRTAVEEGHFVQGKLAPGLARSEVNLHAMTAGVAMLSLYAWLISLKQLLLQHGAASMPPLLAVVTDKGKGSREQGNLVVKEAIQAVMQHWEAPFRPVVDGGYSGLLESGGLQVSDWLLSEAFEWRLCSFFPCTDIVPPLVIGQVATTLDPATAIALDDVDFGKETAVERRCCEAFAAVRHFEKTHCLALQNMGYSYLQRRAALVARCLGLAERLGVAEEAAHDAVLLMDRVMSTGLSLQPELLELLATASLTVAVKQGDGPARVRQLPPDVELEAVTGLPPAAIEQMEWSIRQVLGQDTAAISALRCLKLYLERLGAGHVPAPAAAAIAGKTLLRARESLTDMAFLNCRPSVIAAALLYVERRAQGMIPFWPTMLAKLTGYQDMSTPELAVAIKAAQRLTARSARSSSSLTNALSSRLGSRTNSSASLSSLTTGTSDSLASSAGSGAAALPHALVAAAASSAGLLGPAAAGLPVTVAAQAPPRPPLRTPAGLPQQPVPVMQRGAATIEQQLFALQNALAAPSASVALPAAALQAAGVHASMAPAPLPHRQLSYQLTTGPLVGGLEPSTMLALQHQQGNGISHAMGAGILPYVSAQPMVSAGGYSATLPLGGASAMLAPGGGQAATLPAGLMPAQLALMVGGVSGGGPMGSAASLAQHSMTQHSVLAPSAVAQHVQQYYGSHGGQH